MRTSFPLPLFLGTLLALACTMTWYERTHPLPPAAPARTAPGLSVTTGPRPVAIPYHGGTAGNYLGAHHASLTGDHQKAADYIDQVFKETAPKEGMLMLSMRHHLLAGNIEKAIALSHQASPSQQSSGAVQLLRLVENLHNGDGPATENAAAALKPDGLQSLILPFTESWFSFAKTGAAERVDIADNLKQGMYNVLQSYHEALQYQLLKDKKSAAASYETAVSSLRFTPDATLFAAVRFFEADGKHERALSLVNAVKEQRGRDALWNMRDTEGYVRELAAYGGSDVTSLKDGIAEILANTGTLLLHEGIGEEAQSFFQLSLYLRPKDGLTRFALAEAQEESRQYASAVASYAQVGEPPFLKDAARLYLARTWHAAGDSGKARDLLHGMEATNHAAYNVAVMLGDLERIDKHYAAAAEEYGRALTALSELKPYDWPLLFQRGVMYDQADQWDKALADFQATLKLQPNEPQVLNYLGYSWLMRGQRLPEAEAMLKAALAASPNEPNIMDSYGYALYLRKDYKGADAQLEKALAITPQDPTMNEHYGDILWHLGRQTEARYHWDRALLFKPTESGAEARIKEKLEKSLND